MAKRGRTIAVLLGASEYPEYPTLDASPAFRNSKDAILDYLKSRNGMALGEKDILDLYESGDQPGLLLSKTRQFIRTHVLSSEPATDLIFYYCGHGGYFDDDEYFLALRCSHKEHKEPTIFKISYLADLARNYAQKLRTLVILDACYAGGALTEFAHGDAEERDANAMLNAQLQDAVGSDSDGSSEDPRGIVLFCAAAPKKWARTPLESEYTMFSGALIGALKRGDRRSGAMLSLKRFAEIVSAEIRMAFGSHGVQPQVHVPVQGSFDLLSLQYFPNPAFDATAYDQRLSTLEFSVGDIRTDIVRINDSLKELIERPASTTEIATTPNADKRIAQSQELLFRKLTAIGPILPQLATIFVVDVLTYLLLRAGAMTTYSYDGSPPSGGVFTTFVGALLFAALLHVAAVVLSYAIHSEQSGTHFLFPRTVLSLFPANINYSTLTWNSCFVLAILACGLIFPENKMAQLFM